MATASVIALLQAALSLLTLVQSTPNLPQSLQTTAIQTAEQAITVATSQLSSGAVVTQSSVIQSSAAGVQTASLSEDTTFQASQTSGTAPLMVTFSRGSFAGPIVGQQYPNGVTPLNTLAQADLEYGINFGDGTPVQGFQASCANTTSGSCTTLAPTVTHTYSTQGTYTAQLLYRSYASLQAACAAYANSDTGCPAAVSLLQPINSTTITVQSDVMGSNTAAQPSATIDQSTVQTSTDSSGDTIVPPFTGTASGVSKVNVVVIDSADLASTGYAGNTMWYLPNHGQGGTYPLPIIFQNLPVQNGEWQILQPDGSSGPGNIIYTQLSPIPSSLTVLVYNDSNGPVLGEAPLVQKTITVQQ